VLEGGFCAEKSRWCERQSDLPTLIFGLSLVREYLPNRFTNVQQGAFSPGLAIWGTYPARCQGKPVGTARLRLANLAIATGVDVSLVTFAGEKYSDGYKYKRSPEAPFVILKK